jgi:hypothetical protein
MSVLVSYGYEWMWNDKGKNFWMKQKQYTDILRCSLFNSVVFYLISKTENTAISHQPKALDENDCGWKD